MPQGKRLAGPAVQEDGEVMRKKFRRKLERQIKKANDPRRYLIASRIAGTWAFYYDVGTDAFVMNEPKCATIFKSRKIARAVKKALGKRYKIVAAIKGRNGGLRIPAKYKSPTKGRAPAHSKKKRGA